MLVIISVTGNVSQKNSDQILRKYIPKAQTKQLFVLLLKLNFLGFFLLLGKTQGKSVKLP